MLVTADEVTHSFRGTTALFTRHAKGLKSFDMTEKGFWHSFGAIWLALPALVVGLPFVVVTNWSLAVGLTLLSVPAALLILGWATPGLTVLFALAFGILVVHLLWSPPRPPSRSRAGSPPRSSGSRSPSTG
jgi:hypothetical protein